MTISSYDRFKRIIDIVKLKRNKIKLVSKKLY